MGTQRRYYEKDAIYHVSNRTIRGCALLTPTEDVATAVMNNLAWAADIHGVDIYYFVVHPDGFDMFVSSEHLTISQFMGDFEGLTAKEVNALHGESGRFWADTFQCTKVESDVQLEQLAQIVDLPRNRGFVGHPHDWEGVSSWGLLEEGGETFGVRVDRTLAREIRRAEPEVSYEHSLELATTTHSLKLKRLPGFEDVSQAEYLATILVAAGLRTPCELSGNAACEVEVSAEGARADAAVLSIEAGRDEAPVGMEAVRGWPTTLRLERCGPRRPTYLTRSQVLKERHQAAHELRNLRYEWARKRLRYGLGEPEFPAGMIPIHKTRPVGWSEPPAYRRRSSRYKRAA